MRLCTRSRPLSPTRPPSASSSHTTHARCTPMRPPSGLCGPACGRAELRPLRRPTWPGADRVQPGLLRPSQQPARRPPPLARMRVETRAPLQAALPSARRRAGSGVSQGRCKARLAFKLGGGPGRRTAGARGNAICGARVSPGASVQTLCATCERAFMGAARRVVVCSGREERLYSSASGGALQRARAARPRAPLRAIAPSRPLFPHPHPQK